MSDEPLLIADDVTAGYLPGIDILTGCDLKLHQGEFVGIIGPNGAGKSTFFNSVTGVLAPTGGRIVFDGEDITGLPPHAISQKAIARSYQITNILPGASVLENVRIAVQSRHHAWSLLKHHRSYRDVIERARSVLEAVGLADKQDELAANLSHGEQRNLEIGIALATEPFELGYGDENMPYDRGDDRYRVKNARMDSVDELFLERRRRGRRSGRKLERAQKLAQLLGGESRAGRLPRVGEAEEFRRLDVRRLADLDDVVEPHRAHPGKQLAEIAGAHPDPPGDFPAAHAEHSEGRLEDVDQALSLRLHWEPW